MLLLLGRGITFFNDEWTIVLQRPGFNGHSILDPHGPHLVALTIVSYKALIAVFGLESQTPHLLLLVGTVIALAIVVFVYVRERAGNVLALLAAAVLLFLGSGWEDLLWPFQIGFTGALAAGIGALLVLERDTPRRNLSAALLLVLAVSISDLGLPFVVAATLAVLLRGRPSQLWIPGVAATLFAAWWLSYGHDVSSGLSLSNIARLPVYFLDSISSGLASLAGLERPLASPQDAFVWGRPLLVLVAVATAVWLSRGRRPSSGVLVIAGAGLTFWLLAGANYIAGREPQVSRYQLVTCTFLILIAAEFFRPVRLRPAGLAAVSAIVLVAIGSNLNQLREGHRFLYPRWILAKAELGALDIGRGHIPSELTLVQPIARDHSLWGISAGSYYRETDAHGPLPAYTPQQIAGADPVVQQGVDSVLAAGYGLKVEPVPLATIRTGSNCLLRKPQPQNLAQDVALPPGNVVIVNRGAIPIDVGVRRFAPVGYPIDIGNLGGHFAAILRVPRDSVRRAWHLSATGGSPFEVCAG